eukprot:CAMPEP_0197187388 /NCGR_PEP_ID=MMETSP1423-20130617/15768_1 /TAXON_ID=476441 /ORGANISM="Pseudo-nitzschia heimii, Strain UNC1101" /LENGTH=492 /DNA_ID=CAMNT_0042638949 /DNA_START=194 /DNA_END=1672 /DNA_ORIENTATION=-
MVEHKITQRVHFEALKHSQTKCMAKDFFTIILVVVFLITPEFVSGSAVESHFNIRTTTPLSVPSFFENHRIPRGGGIGSGRKGSTHLQVLDDEIIWLEQQLRRVEQEKHSLKNKIAKRQQIREDLLQRSIGSRKGRGNASSALDKKNEDSLRLANLEQLDKQKASLLTARKQLEAIKTDYDQKINALQSDLFLSTSKRKSLEETFLARVKELEISMRKVREAAANPKIHDDPELSRKIDEACRAAITEFWVEGNRKLEEHERRLKARNEQDLLEERRLATLAVEKQRVKMRALARAMAIREKEIVSKTKKSRMLSRTQPRISDVENQCSKQKSTADKNRDEKLEREKLKAIREEAERKAKEEEERLWQELEKELQRERERLQRMKQREEEERLRCEQEELERRRLLQQHALDMQERLRREQINASTNGNGSGSNGDSLFRRLFTPRKKKVKTRQILVPAVASIENYQRRVVWQPVSLPPKEAVRITGPSSGS